MAARALANAARGTAPVESASTAMACSRTSVAKAYRAKSARNVERLPGYFVLSATSSSIATFKTRSAKVHSAESQNTRMRTNIRRLTRLTNGHSKKLENHVHAMALWFQYYNFARPHMTLTKEKGGIKTTPAMAAGIADHVWKMEEIVALLSL